MKKHVLIALLLTSSTLFAEEPSDLSTAVKEQMKIQVIQALSEIQKNPLPSKTQILTEQGRVFVANANYRLRKARGGRCKIRAGGTLTLNVPQNSFSKARLTYFDLSTNYENAPKSPMQRDPALCLNGQVVLAGNKLLWNMEKDYFAAIEAGLETYLKNHNNDSNK